VLDGPFLLEPSFILFVNSIGIVYLTFFIVEYSMFELTPIAKAIVFITQL
jgi:hypothetical protein